jgi:lipopolysaccharide/colanic/teichoic acid biosynthesis glycosyltransferase
MYRAFGKRLLDIVIAAIALLALAPLMLVTAAVVRLSLGRPVVFRQMRPGRYGAPFAILKFRTMHIAANASAGDAARMTRVGKWLRALSLDELPELVNVLRGEMSLVGPRPLLMQYLGRYTAEQARRHEAPPGITGWAQINGRNALTWEEKFRYDVWYVDHCSFLLDMRILAMTIIKTLARDGITHPGHATAEEFRGSATV